MSPLPSLEPYFGVDIFIVITLKTYEKDEITDNYTDRCKIVRLVLSLEASFISFSVVNSSCVLTDVLLKHTERISTSCRFTSDCGLLFQVFVAVALPSLAYRDASEYNADLEGLQLISFLLGFFPV